MLHLPSPIVGCHRMKDVERMYIRQEVTQHQEEGSDTGDLEARVEAAMAMGSSPALKASAKTESS